MAEDADNVMPVVLTIAGSDSGGGAGIQADLRVFGALGCFGTTAVSCITAQNPAKVDAVEPVPPQVVAQQVRSVCDGFAVSAAKTGMLYSADIIEAVAGVVAECGICNLVVDPVMVSSSGAGLLRDDAAEALRELLLPKAVLITPNLAEAQELAGMQIETAADMARAAMQIGEQFGTACVVKGGHLAAEQSGGCVLDVLYLAGSVVELRSPRVAGGGDIHGTGCSFAAAVAAGLAHGVELEQAVADAQRYLGQAMERSRQAGRYRVLGVAGK
jgi:hydroxymethylpyrimidine/phosphomethylpyrimidine kinase